MLRKQVFGRQRDTLLVSVLLRLWGVGFETLCCVAVCKRLRLFLFFFFFTARPSWILLRLKLKPANIAGDAWTWKMRLAEKVLQFGQYFTEISHFSWTFSLECMTCTRTSLRLCHLFCGCLCATCGALSWNGAGCDGVASSCASTTTGGGWRGGQGWGAVLWRAVSDCKACVRTQTHPVGVTIVGSKGDRIGFLLNPSGLEGTLPYRSYNTCPDRSYYDPAFLAVFNWTLCMLVRC